MRRFTVFLVLMSIFIFSCAGKNTTVRPGKGVYHSVKKGETLSEIARAYGVNQRKLAELNNIRHPEHLETDSVVFIPDAVRVIDVGRASKARATGSPEPAAGTVKKDAGKSKPPSGGAKKRQEGETRHGGAPAPERRPGESSGAAEKNKSKEAAASSSSSSAAPSASAAASPGRGSFAWPVRGRVTSRFGRQPNGMVFNHIRIAARDQAQIVAAASGTVIFSAPLRDFGETVIIKHDHDFATVYTHLGSRSIQADARVKKGEIIGMVGKSEKKGEGHINFEIRRHNKAIDPLLFLP
ncbi:MAG TPA: M23 family metallopeptidase [Syntrophales bacterium]|nr:M23 family metallopeptidase [Syntrophales bacterium]HRR46563.1 M23 family metallopeptidase [Syntrophales bacterium]